MITALLTILIARSGQQKSVAMAPIYSPSIVEYMVDWQQNIEDQET